MVVSQWLWKAMELPNTRSLEEEIGLCGHWNEAGFDPNDLGSNPMQLDRSQLGMSKKSVPVDKKWILKMDTRG